MKSLKPKKKVSELIELIELIIMKKINFTSYSQVLGHHWNVIGRIDRPEAG